jgi:adenine-specific DNA-methyltransferase
LLTATPLQNSLLELYGLLTFLHEHTFGNLDSFREQFVTINPAEAGRRNSVLRQRLQGYCQRTLRREVQEYVRFTRRFPITQQFRPGDDEHALYQGVSAYLQRDDLLALPTRQRTLMTLVLRKLLASSSFAIARTLRRLVARLEALAQGSPLPGVLADKTEFDMLAEVRDEWLSEAAASPVGTPDPAALQSELAELRQLAAQAEAITHNHKGATLLQTLPTAFAKLARMGAACKVVIFTELRRTQDYLRALLEAIRRAGSDHQWLEC